MVEEAYVSFETAKLLKEKGFDIPVWTRYEDSNEVIFGNKYNWNNSPMGQISAPTIQMVMRWLREVHNIFVEIGVSIDLNGKYNYSYSVLSKECRFLRKGYTDFDWTYEESAEAAIKYCLKNLI